MPAIVTDNPEDPEDLDHTNGEIEEDTGSTQKPPGALEDSLSIPSVSNNTDPIFPWGDSQEQEKEIHDPGYPDSPNFQSDTNTVIHNTQPELQTSQEQD